MIKLEDHPLLTATIVSSIVMGVGWFRMDQIVHIQEEDRQERIMDGIQACEERNAAWDKTMDHLLEEGASVSVIEAIRQDGIIECPNP